MLQHDGKSCCTVAIHRTVPEQNGPTRRGIEVPCTNRRHVPGIVDKAMA